MKKVKIDLFRKKIKSLRDLPFFLFMPKKNIVIILSAMRTGSTLLKALLAKAPDVSHLPELDYRVYFRGGRFNFYKKVYYLSPKKIIVLKAPHWFVGSKELRILPKLSNIKIIVLTRDVYGVIQSLTRRHKDTECSHLTSIDFLNYWCESYESIMNSVDSLKKNLYFVRYEDILNNSVLITSKLFNFIGSCQKEGVDSYTKSENFDFKYRIGDGSEKIKSLKVQRNNRAEVNNKKLEKIIDNSERARSLRMKFGYLSLKQHSGKNGIF